MIKSLVVSQVHIFTVPDHVPSGQSKENHVTNKSRVLLVNPFPLPFIILFPRAFLSEWVHQRVNSQSGPHSC